MSIPLDKHCIEAIAKIEGWSTKNASHHTMYQRFLKFRAFLEGRKALEPQHKSWLKKEALIRIARSRGKIVSKSMETDDIWNMITPKGLVPRIESRPSSAVKEKIYQEKDSILERVRDEEKQLYGSRKKSDDIFVKSPPKLFITDCEKLNGASTAAAAPKKKRKTVAKKPSPDPLPLSALRTDLADVSDTISEKGKKDIPLFLEPCDSSWAAAARRRGGSGGAKNRPSGGKKEKQKKNGDGGGLPLYLKEAHPPQKVNDIHIPWMYCSEIPQADLEI